MASGETRTGPSWYVAGKTMLLLALAGVVVFREAVGLGVIATLAIILAMIVLTAHILFLLVR